MYVTLNVDAKNKIITVCGCFSGTVYILSTCTGKYTSHFSENALNNWYGTCKNACIL